MRARSTVLVVAVGWVRAAQDTGALGWSKGSTGGRGNVGGMKKPVMEGKVNRRIS